MVMIRNLRVFRNGFGAHEGKNLSLYLNLGPQELLKTKPYDKIYARAMLRVPNQGQSNYIVERPRKRFFFVFLYLFSSKIQLMCSYILLLLSVRLISNVVNHHDN